MFTRGAAYTELSQRGITKPAHNIYMVHNTYIKVSNGGMNFIIEHDACNWDIVHFYQVCRL